MVLVARAILVTGRCTVTAACRSQRLNSICLIIMMETTYGRTIKICISNIMTGQTGSILIRCIAGLGVPGVTVNTIGGGSQYQGAVAARARSMTERTGIIMDTRYRTLGTNRMTAGTGRYIRIKRRVIMAAMG